MRMNMRKQVDARITAIVVIVVLAVIQYIWWKGLVYKPKLSGPPRQMSGGQPNMTEPLTVGRKDVKVETIAGSTDPGDSDGVGRNARFDSPCGLALDKAGNVIVADSKNHRIRMIAPDGKTSTLAGGEAGCEDGPVSQAKFNMPCGVAAGPDGTVYVADSGNNRIRAIKDGQVRTLAGSRAGFAEGAGALAKFNTPIGVAFSPGSSSILVADSANKRIRQVSLAGQASTLAALPAIPTSVIDNGGPVATISDKGAVFGKGSLINVAVPGTKIKLNHPIAICTAPDGWYITDADHCALFQAKGNNAEVLAGACVSIRSEYGYRDGPADQALFGQITGIATNGNGIIYVSDISNNCIRRITLPEAAK
jgi:DNA-binding beta-propeller fold protein YncE